MPLPQPVIMTTKRASAHTLALPIVMPTPNDVLQLRMIMFSLRNTPTGVVAISHAAPTAPDSSHLHCVSTPLPDIGFTATLSSKLHARTPDAHTWDAGQRTPQRACVKEEQLAEPIPTSES
jgi:hypothetical protein